MKLIATILMSLFLGSITLGLTGCASDNYSGYEDAQAGHHKSSRQRAFEPRGHLNVDPGDVLAGGFGG